MDSTDETMREREERMALIRAAAMEKFAVSASSLKTPPASIKPSTPHATAPDTTSAQRVYSMLADKWHKFAGKMSKLSNRLKLLGGVVGTIGFAVFTVTTGGVGPTILALGTGLIAGTAGLLSLANRAAKARRTKLEKKAAAAGENVMGVSAPHRGLMNFAWSLGIATKAAAATVTLLASTPVVVAALPLLANPITLGMLLGGIAIFQTVSIGIRWYGQHQQYKKTLAAFHRELSSMMALLNDPNLPLDRKAQAALERKVVSLNTKIDRYKKLQTSWRGTTNMRLTAVLLSVASIACVTTLLVVGSALTGGLLPTLMLIGASLFSFGSAFAGFMANRHRQKTKGLERSLKKEIAATQQHVEEAVTAAKNEVSQTSAHENEQDLATQSEHTAEVELEQARPKTDANPQNDVPEVPAAVVPAPVTVVPPPVASPDIPAAITPEIIAPIAPTEPNGEVAPAPAVVPPPVSIPKQDSSNINGDQWLNLAQQKEILTQSNSPEQPEMTSFKHHIANNSGTALNDVTKHTPNTDQHQAAKAVSPVTTPQQGDPVVDTQQTPEPPRPVRARV